MIFALGLPINNSPNPVQLEAMGTSAYEFKTGDNCKELFSTIIAINNNIHFKPPIKYRLYKDIRVLLSFN